MTALLYFFRFTEKHQQVTIHAGKSSTMFDEIIIVVSRRVKVHTN